MRVRSTRNILLTDFPEVENPGGIVVPPAISTTKRVSSARTAIWDFLHALEVPTVEICTPELTFTTYSGSGTWCGFKAFFTRDGITRRFLTKSVKGVNQYENEYGEPLWPTWYEPTVKRIILDTIRDAVNDGLDHWDLADVPVEKFNGFNSIETIYYGQAAYDPDDGCSLANGITALRRTNGNPYPFLTSYGVGPATESTVVADPNDMFGSSFGFYGIVVTGYNDIQYVGDTIKNYTAWGHTMLGNQLGSHTVFGFITELLGDENTLYDQLVRDGAVVTTTRASSLASFDDGNGAYEGELSSFTFTKPDDFNEYGQNYVLTFQVTVTSGMDSSTENLLVQYTGTGVSGEQMTVPIPPKLNSTVTFDGSCITIQSLGQVFEDFEELVATNYTKDGDPATEGWSNQGWFGCGTPSTISMDSHEDARVISSERMVISGPQDTGHCWGDAGWFGGNDAEFSVQSYEYLTAGPTGATETSGSGWKAPGWFGGLNQPQSVNDYEEETAGAATSETGGHGWGGAGWFG